MWTKNIELGIRAFQEFARGGPEAADFRLVIAGIVDDKSRPYFERLQQMAGGDHRIEFHVFPSAAEMEDLYARCYGVLFTAFNEDFGIVPLESMAFGKPVIAVNRGGPRETVPHDVAGFLAEPDAPSFSARMRELAGDEALARRFGRAGPDQAKKFHWQSFVGCLDEVVERSAGITTARKPVQEAISGETLEERIQLEETAL